MISLQRKSSSPPTAVPSCPRTDQILRVSVSQAPLGCPGPVVVFRGWEALLSPTTLRKTLMTTLGIWRQGYKSSLMSRAGVSLVLIFNHWEQFFEFPTIALLLTIAAFDLSISWLQVQIAGIVFRCQDIAISSEFLRQFRESCVRNEKGETQRDQGLVRSQGQRTALQSSDSKSPVCLSVCTHLLCPCAQSPELGLEGSHVNCNGQVTVSMKITGSLGSLSPMEHQVKDTECALEYIDIKYDYRQEGEPLRCWLPLLNTTLKRPHKYKQNIQN